MGKHGVAGAETERLESMGSLSVRYASNIVVRVHFQGYLHHQYIDIDNTAVWTCTWHTPLHWSTRLVAPPQDRNVRCDARSDQDPHSASESVISATIRSSLASVTSPSLVLRPSLYSRIDHGTLLHMSLRSEEPLIRY